MFAALVIVGLCLVITSLTSGPAVVTHDCTPGQLIVSLLLSNITAVSRLLFVNTAGRIFPACRRQSSPAVLVAMILLLGGVETNPGPAASTAQSGAAFGLLNARSVVHKATLIHDVIADHRLDVLAITETCTTSDAPDAIKLDVAPPGFQVTHQPRGSSTDKRGGGIAIIHRDNIVSR